MEKKIDRKGESYWTDANRDYDRVVGGMAWPQGMDPGAVIIIGEGTVEDNATKRVPLYLLEERFEPIAQIFRTMRDLFAGYRMDIAFLGDPSDEAMMARLYAFNREQPVGRRGATVGLNESLLAKTPNNINAGWQLIEGYLGKGRKILHLPKESRLQSSIETLSPEDTKGSGNIARWPLLAAVVYVLDYFDRYRDSGPSEDEMRRIEKQQEEANKDYDAFSY
jgi:hypothetical protein